jgi:hypothetical protein
MYKFNQYAGQYGNQSFPGTLKSYANRYGNGYRSFFPYIGPIASVMGLLRSGGVVLAFILLFAPQALQGVPAELLQTASIVAALLIIFPLLRHFFVVLWSLSGLLLWATIGGVLLLKGTGALPMNVVPTMPHFGLPTLSAPFFSGNSPDFFLENSQVKQDSAGNELVYKTFPAREPGESADSRTVTVPARNESLPSSLSTATNNIGSWIGQSLPSPGVKKDYHVSMTHEKTPSWAVQRNNDNMYFPKPRTDSSDSGSFDKNANDLEQTLKNAGNQITSNLIKK